jgi:hypothetical protein
MIKPMPNWSDEDLGAQDGESLARAVAADYVDGREPGLDYDVRAIAEVALQDQIDIEPGEYQWTGNAKFHFGESFCDTFGVEFEKALNATAICDTCCGQGCKRHI